LESCRRSHVARPCRGSNSCCCTAPVEAGHTQLLGPLAAAPLDRERTMHRSPQNPPHRTGHSGCETGAHAYPWVHRHPAGLAGLQPTREAHAARARAPRAPGHSGGHGPRALPCLQGVNPQPLASWQLQNAPPGAARNGGQPSAQRRRPGRCPARSPRPRVQPEAGALLRGSPAPARLAQLRASCRGRLAGAPELVAQHIVADHVRFKKETRPDALDWPSWKRNKLALLQATLGDGCHHRQWHRLAEESNLLPPRGRPWGHPSAGSSSAAWHAIMQ
jgi:hypothetical protein